MESGTPSAPFQGSAEDISLIAALGLPNTSSKEDVLGAMQNLQRLAALGRQAEIDLRMPVVPSSTTANLNITSEPGNLHLLRDEPANVLCSGTSPVAEPPAERSADPPAGKIVAAETSAELLVWPDMNELLELGVAMLTGGSGAPAAPSTLCKPAEATYTLLLRITLAIAKLKKDHGADMHMVPGTAGRIDQQEGRGYLLGAVLGRGLLGRKEAVAVGLEARNKLTAIERRLAAHMGTSTSSRAMLVTLTTTRVDPRPIRRVCASG